jgi:hypothetical protein
MTILAERIQAEVRRPRQPLPVRTAVLQATAWVIYTPTWVLGRLARGVVVAARFAWAAGRVGISDGYGTRTLT